MKRLNSTFESLKQRKEAAFMPFLVIGDPDFETSLELAKNCIAGGADIMEFGFAYSDPPADGPAIQLADQRSLAAGFTTDRAFQFMENLRKDTEVPFALLIYFNLVMQYGIREFYKRASDVGIDAILIADLPLEESSEILHAAEEFNIAPIFIVTELTSAERLLKITPLAKGYLYVVTNLGVTGTRQELGDSLTATINRLRPHTDIPMLAGFGISTPEHVKSVLKAGADGAIVGSALIKQIEKNLEDVSAMNLEVRQLCSRLKEATR